MEGNIKFVRLNYISSSECDNWEYLVDVYILFYFPCESNKAKIRNRHNQVPHLTQDTTWGSDKNDKKHHIQESQDTSPFPAGDHKVAMNRLESMTNTKHK